MNIRWRWILPSVVIVLDLMTIGVLLASNRGGFHWHHLPYGIKMMMQYWIAWQALPYLLSDLGNSVGTRFLSDCLAKMIGDGRSFGIVIFYGIPTLFGTSVSYWGGLALEKGLSRYGRA